MTDMSKHATKRHHRRFLLAIAIPAAVEIWACWVGLGSMCGFPVIGRNGHGIPTDWTLAVGMEAYGTYALHIWLNAAPGPRSRQFAQFSALGAFALSLIAQVAYHLMLARHMTRAPAFVVVFVACLPVVVLAFAAILTHLIHADERAAADAAEEATLRATLAAEQSARLLAEAERDAARREAADAAARAEATQAAAGERRGSDTATPRPSRRKSVSTATRNEAMDPVAQAAEVVTLEEARIILDAEPDISGSELGRRLGFKPSYGRTLKRKLTTPAPGGGR